MSVVLLVLLNIAAQVLVLRWDLTEDKRHTLSSATKSLVKSLDDKAIATVYLKGDFNSGFTQLSVATGQLLSELSHYGKLRHSFINPNTLDEQEKQQLDRFLLSHHLQPVAIYERNKQGINSETVVYPFAVVRYKDKEIPVSLLNNQRGLSGSENLNRSVEGLEYAFALCLSRLLEEERQKVVFLEGQAELPEQNTQDVEQALAEYFDVYRGTVTTDADCLTPFSALIVADPQQPFSEVDKYIIDHYVMQGGKVLWVLNGVQFSEQTLQDEGFTPILPLDLNLTDMLFRYGVRVNNRLIQDLQCLSVPVDVSRNPDIPQYQPMPWTYSPLLLTSSLSPITKNLSPVSATFCSDISSVGNSDKVQQTILLATSDASTATQAPAEVNLQTVNLDTRFYTQANLPVAVSLEGEFKSAFTHRMCPEGVNSPVETRTLSKPTKQIVVAAGSVISNDTEHGKLLPTGYDRYSRKQFANRDFILNSLLWLTDTSGLLQLRQKNIPLRLLNAQKTTNMQILTLFLAIALPLLLLSLAGCVITITRKHRYAL